VLARRRSAKSRISPKLPVQRINRASPCGQP
jgi:hypothetical protein